MAPATERGERIDLRRGNGGASARLGGHGITMIVRVVVRILGRAPKTVALGPGRGMTLFAEYFALRQRRHLVHSRRYISQ